MRPRAVPRLDRVPVCPPGGEGEEAGPEEVPLFGHGLPGFPEGELQARGRVRVRARRVRVLAPPGPVPDPALQGRDRVPSSGLLLRPHARPASGAAPAAAEEPSGRCRILRRVSASTFDAQILAGIVSHFHDRVGSVFVAFGFSPRVTRRADPTGLDVEYGE